MTDDNPTRKLTQAEGDEIWAKIRKQLDADVSTARRGLQVELEVVQAAVNVLFVIAERHKFNRRLYVLHDGRTTTRELDRHGNETLTSDPIKGDFTQHTLCFGERTVTFFVEATHRPRSVRDQKEFTP